MFFVCLSYNLEAQELKVKKKSTALFIEEYQVLKSDKNVKHGYYVKSKNPKNYVSLGVPIFKELGNYEKGQKTGKWYFFNDLGDLESEGIYQNGLMQGLWITYYQAIFLNYVSFFASAINKNYQLDKDGVFTINRDSLQLSSKGVYDKNLKIGSWNYYSREGDLIHKFDHTLNSMIYPDSILNTTVYWGRPYLESVLTVDLLVNTFNFKNKESGKMYVLFEVTETGMIQNVTFHNSIDDDFNKGFMSGLMKTSGLWFPSRQTQSFVLPFEFSDGKTLLKEEENFDFGESIYLSTFSIDLGKKLFD